ncbi:sugar phosphate isomerase/epimerase family protein [Bacillus sp. NEB1478]|uniref:sugar phosphate isomerase/epimerase family protein n=1 Tax=Bacillus sp. NEB1478 TaxID=3073816 RepID=UPI002873F1BB|nr:sugar phosphate isomerase/epimerase family protein [Bacillus sp. NEB1478]WNB92636.1 sugar phosphate isomerase/epimerase family protein [Bacillus sp. NEB1478]
MMMLTGFGDEVSSELGVQLDVLEAEGIKHLDLRGVWGKNVIELTEQEWSIIKKEIGRRGFQVSCIASPIGKIDIREDFSSQLKELDQVISLAKDFNTPYIRVFSFFIPKEDDPYIYRDEVISRTRDMVKKAEQANVTLLHENEKGIYGDDAERCLDLLKTVESANFRAVFDMANFVQCGVKPYTDAYPILQPYIEYVHIKDAQFSNGKVVPAGYGDGEIEELIGKLKSEGYDGFLSLEHHLAPEGEFAGYNGSQLFRQAAQALRNILSKVQV